MKFLHCVILLFSISYYNTVFSQVSCQKKCYNHIPFIHSSKPIEVEKKWESEYSVITNVIPIVSDINNDGKTEILIPKRLDENLYNYSNTLMILDGETGIVLSEIVTPFIYSIAVPYAIMDINNDCVYEIFIIASEIFDNPFNIRGKIICYSLDGNILWISNSKVDPQNLLNTSDFGSISFADFNLDGIPELYVMNEIYNARTGVLLVRGGANGAGIKKWDANRPIFGKTVACNLDNDPQLELAAGYSVYKVNITNPNGINGNSMIPINIDFDGHLRDGYTSVADINFDGKLDVIVSSDKFVVHSTNIEVGLYAYTIENNKAKLLANTSKWDQEKQSFMPGPTTIFYNETQESAEILLIAELSHKFWLLSYTINSSLGFDLNWRLEVDDSPATIGVAVFDLNGDGLDEIILRDHYHLKIINVKNDVPEIIFQTRCLSGTNVELPIIVNLDSSNQSRICISCGDEISLGNFGKLNVFGAPEGQTWAPARKIWHQYAYNPLFINDDGTVPQYQENHATYKNGRYNNFMVQESLIDENGNVPVPAASLNGEMQCLEYDINTNLYSITFDIFNKDEASAMAISGTPISFYDGNPETGGVYMGTYNTTQEITPGSSLTNLEFQINAPLTGPIWMVINTDKTNIVLSDSSQYQIPECDYTDNVFVIHDIPQVNHTTIEICEGDTYIFYGQQLSTSGQYLYEEKSLTGCDSIIYLIDLTTTNTKTSEHQLTVCDSYTWNGTSYTQSGTYTYQTISTNGCDSIATLDLTVHQRTESATILASCDTYDWNGQTYTQSGMYTFLTQNVHGCDSVASLFLTITPSSLDTSFVTTCDDYAWSGSTYNQSGTYIWSGQTTSGCDSILTLVLNLQNTIETEENISACDSYEWNGNTYTSTGLYTHQTISSLGCDSIVTLYLEVFPTVVVEENLTACDTLVWNGQTYDESGFYTHESHTFNGCDSITQLYLTILSSSITNLSVEACESYTLNGQTYQSSGIYTYQSTNHLGCDSTVVLDLTIHSQSSSSTEISACDEYEWNGNFYTQSGSYDFSSLNQYGCDSTAILELTIHPSYDIPLTLSDCVSVDYLGNSYTESGIYPINLQSRFGCDSVIRLDVRILSESYEDIQTSCDSFYWPVSDEYFDQSGVYQQTFTNIDGCDSTFSLTLEINPSYKETENITTCDNYLWNVNQNIYTESGLYEFRTQTQKGCDSIRLLKLNVEKSFEQRDTITSTTTYQWPINNQEYDQSGNYELRFTSINGCDSLYFLVLRINQDFEVLFPNIISSESANGKFKAYSTHPQILLKKLSVFDRMASRVYHIENVLVQDENYGWDGRFNGELVLPGVYGWIAELILPDGAVKQMVGDVTVIR